MIRTATARGWARAVAGTAALGLLVPMTMAQASSLSARPSFAGFNRPLCFEANRGQADAEAPFLARGLDYQFFIAPTRLQFVLRRVTDGPPASLLEQGPAAGARRIRTRAVRMDFVHANPQAGIHGAEELPGNINYLIGSAPAQWRSGVPTYARVQVEDLYPGVNLAYYGNQQQLEYDILVAPGADPAVITLRFEGVDQLTLDNAGNLILKLGPDEIRQPRPAFYQVVGGIRKPVDGAYRLQDARTVGFRVGSYDRRRTLVIDPTLSYATYFGGGAADTALAVAVGLDGSVYVAGNTLSSRFVTNVPGAFPDYSGGKINGDAFVARFSNDGSNLVYFTYLGGRDDDGATGVAVDASGSAYVAGYTDSPDFPVRSLLLTNTQGSTSYTNLNGGSDPLFHAFRTDAFIAKLGPEGTNLVYSIYLGGDGVDVGTGIALDPGTNVYVTGYTDSTNFPAVNAWQDRPGGSNDVFVTRISADGTQVAYSTYFGGTNVDQGEGIAADAAQCAYVSGFTASTNFFTTTNAWQRELNGTNAAGNNWAYDAFVAKFDTSRSGSNSMVYSTLLGGSNSDIGVRLVLDADANACVVGYSRSWDFPNTATNVAGLHFGVTNKGSINNDAFLTKINTNGTGLVYSALFGGGRSDEAVGVALDPAGNVFVVGYTLSIDFPTNQVGSLSATHAGSNDVFVTVFTPDASALLYSAYLGGAHDDFGYGIAVDPAGNAYIVGRTSSANFPVTNAFQTARSGTEDAFLAKILMDPALQSVLTDRNLQLQWRAFTPEFGLESSLELGPNAAWSPVPGPPTLSNGWHIVELDATNNSQFFRLRKN